MLYILLMAISFLALSSCRREFEIVMREVAQLPYRTVYIAGVDDALDMEGFIVRLHSRNGQFEEHSFYDVHWNNVRHEIDFTAPGEYEVFFYWGRFNFGSMTIQVIAPD